MVAVDVFLDEPLERLQGYQLHLSSHGGRRGSLQLLDIAIDCGHPDYVFSDALGETWAAFNVDTRQMLNGLNEAGVMTPAQGYLSTFTFRVSDDAEGAFVVDLLYDDIRRIPTGRTFLFATPTQTVAVSTVNPAVIHVDAVGQHAADATRRRPGFH